MTNDTLIQAGSGSVMDTYRRYPLALARGEGCRVWDADGREYLDFVAGIAVLALGHAPQILQDALMEQAGKLWHCSNLYWTEPQVELADRLAKLSGLDKAFFCNSGAEANEAAIKLARGYQAKRDKKRYEIISFKHSFHGRTLGALTATGQDKYHHGFTPLVPGFVYADYNDLESVEAALTQETAAILVEPLQGEGGIRPATQEFLQGLRQICDQEDILLIFDEVQTGIGRTGTFLAAEHFGVLPDAFTLAKALGGGFPIGALLASAQAATGFVPGDHASTFGGNGLACAVANRLVDEVSQPAFLEQVNAKGNYLRQGLEQLAGDNSHVREIRGLGLMLGMELDVEADVVVKACMDKGLLLVGAGANVVRFVPPLVVSREEIDQALEILKSVLAEL
jgi:predicted acetylornithine/succinylornithine family transaminase